MDNMTDILRAKPEFFIKEFNALSLYIYHIWLCIVFFGLVSNTVNIIVFAKIGFRDNVTVTLLFLSLSDLLNLILRCPVVVARFMGQNYPNHIWVFDRQILYFGFYWPAYLFYDYSSFISVFLALVRCFCVARPLRFKSTFTIPRTVIILVVLFLVALTFRAPVLTVFRPTWSLSPQTNLTYRSLRFADNFREIYKANDIFNRNIVSWVCYITAITCVFILVSKLRAASRFRQSLPTATKLGSTEWDNSTKQTGSNNDGNTAPDKSERYSESLSAKDLKVIQSVTLICIIYILSQLPYQINSTIRLFDPEFANSRKKKYAFGFANHFSNTFSYLNTSVNIFLYYHFNAKYRETFLSLFSKRSVNV